MRIAVLLLGLLGLLACQSNTPIHQQYAATALDGRGLLVPASVSNKKRLSDLAVAKAAFERDPLDLDNIIWLGRRHAYLWQYQKAIDVFSAGLRHHPGSPELYRHRGHRYLTIRQFDLAIKDFERAQELAQDRVLTIEPDGIPNRLNQPLSNLHFNIYYHWGLAHYFKGEFETAGAIFKQCLKWSVNPDLKVATIDWLYMIYQRLGQPVLAQKYLAQVSSDWTLIENDGYLSRIRLYKGQVEASDLLDLSQTNLDAQLPLVTQGYGVGNYFFYNGDSRQAESVFRAILATEYWSAFAYIAAEADLARMQ